MKRHPTWQTIILLILVIGLAVRADATEFTQTDAKSLEDAQRAINAGQLDAAIKLLLPLRTKYPSDGEIPRLLTHAYHQSGQFAKARQMALDAISVGRLTSDILIRLAQIDQQRDDQLALTNEVGLLTIIDTDNHSWRVIYGDLLANGDRLRESAAVFRSLIDEQPQSTPLHLRLGSVLAKLGDNKEAAASYETAWYLGAADPKLAMTIASLWQQMDDNRQALAWTERASQLDGGQDEALQLQYAKLCWDAEEFERAARVAKPLANANDGLLKAEALVLLGQLAMQEGRVEEAIQHWRQATAGGVESPKLLAVIGADYFNKGDYRRAAATLERVVATEDQPNEKNLRFLVSSLIRGGERAAARDRLREYIEQFGLDEQAKRLVRLWAESADK